MINEFKLQDLPQNEIHSFLNAVAPMLNELPALPDAARAFLYALNDYDNALQGCMGSVRANELVDADAQADDAWNALNDYLSSLRAFPSNDPDFNQAVQTVWDVFSKYEDPTQKPYTVEYTVLNQLLDELKALPDHIL